MSNSESDSGLNDPAYPMCRTFTSMGGSDICMCGFHRDAPKHRPPAESDRGQVSARTSRIRADYAEYLAMGGRFSFSEWFERYSDNYPEEYE